MNKLLKLCFQPTSHADKKKLAERIQSLSEAKQWKNKATVADHNLLAGNYAIYYVFRWHWCATSYYSKMSFLNVTLTMS